MATAIKIPELKPVTPTNLEGYLPCGMRDAAVEYMTTRNGAFMVTVARTGERAYAQMIDGGATLTRQSDKKRVPFVVGDGCLIVDLATLKKLIAIDNEMRADIIAGYARVRGCCKPCGMYRQRARGVKGRFAGR